MGEYFEGKAPSAGPRRMPLGVGEYFQATPPPLSGLGQPLYWNDAVLPRYSRLGAAGDQYRTMTAGHVALAGSGGILLGLALMWLWKVRK
jgi:hypothetical protein